jgi:hypothetical protein
MTYVIATMLLVVVLIVGFPFFLQWLAQENILFTTVKEGTVKAIMRGKQFEQFVISFDGYHLNRPSKPGYRHEFPDWEVLYHGRHNQKGFLGDQMNDEYYDKDRPWILKKLGLYWVGLPWSHSVYVYSFEWNETITDRESGGKEKIFPRAAPTDFIYVADFTYAIKTDSAETEDRLPTDELTLVTVAIRNPYRALFSGEDWMHRITAAINRLVRDFVGKHLFEKLISADLSDFSKKIITLKDTLPDDELTSNGLKGLKGRYGVDIRTADLQTIELSGKGNEKHQEAATKAYVAKQEAEATVLTGEARAKVVERIGGAEATALSKRLEVIKKNGDEGMLLAQLDAMRDAGGAGARIIWANSPFIPKGGN